MELNHPVFQEMLQLGCANNLKIMLAFQSYIKLCEVEKHSRIEILYSKTLDVIYFACSAGVNEHRCYVPVSYHEKISPAWINTTLESFQSLHPKSDVYIVLDTPDSTLLTYKISFGLECPMTPETTKEKKAVHEQKQCIQSELYKRKIDLFEIAKAKCEQK